jgi:D-erythro-7,8-dihydroneopterin triphosphate epimerase
MAASILSEGIRMIARIKNLRLRAIIGINEWERVNKQDIILNIEFEFDGSRAAETDSINDTVNYRSMTKRIINDVETSSFGLLEALANMVLNIIMEDEHITRARVEIDKPHALRFSDSVSIECSAERE